MTYAQFVSVSGKPFPMFGTRTHRYRADFPRRWVVDKTHTGWNTCELCGREHRIWMTDDAIWKRLPRRMRKLRICTGCFRLRVTGRLTIA